MATQGLVSVRKNGKVVMKFITGSDGYNAPLLAKALRKLGRVPRLKEAYELALREQFGSPSSLVVMGEKRSFFFHDLGLRLPPRYRRTFGQPGFNPRWEHGTVEHLRILDF